MALVELTSELAIGAGTSVGSPEGRHIAGPDLGVTNVIPNIDATGFTLDVSSLPTQFTLANLPQIGMMEAFGKEGVDVSVMSNPPLKEGVEKVGTRDGKCCHDCKIEGIINDILQSEDLK